MLVFKSEYSHKTSKRFMPKMASKYLVPPYHCLQTPKILIVYCHPCDEAERLRGQVPATLEGSKPENDSDKRQT